MCVKGGSFRGSRDGYQGSGSAKQTWSTGEQQAHIHIHHKTSTVLYTDIWTSSPGRNFRVKDFSVCAKEESGTAEPWLREERGGAGGRERSL